MKRRKIHKKIQKKKSCTNNFRLLKQKRIMKIIFFVSVQKINFTFLRKCPENINQEKFKENIKTL